MLIPVHNGTLGAIEAATDDLFDMLLGRNDDLEHEKMAALAELDAVTAENIQLRQELAAMNREVA
tara:strand:- start:3234 stop:3428 length:195 start_codon:yes stop_codon:yes gene_type:complete